MFNTPLMVGAHAVLGSCLVFQTWQLDRQQYSADAIQAFYRFIWNLFYSEYFLLPFLGA
jgi:homogentisate solanesyltransferase